MKLLNVLAAPLATPGAFGDHMKHKKGKPHPHFVPARGPGSLNAEAEILALYRAGKAADAAAMIRAHREDYKLTLRISDEILNAILAAAREVRFF